MAFPDAPSEVSAQPAKVLPPENIDHSITLRDETVRPCVRVGNTGGTEAVHRNNVCTASWLYGARMYTHPRDPSVPPQIISPSNNLPDGATILSENHSVTVISQSRWLSSIPLQVGK